MVAVSTLETSVLIIWLRFLATLIHPPDSAKVKSFLFKEMTEASDLNLKLHERKGKFYTVFTRTKCTVLINTRLLNEHL